jgi:hypothetical protein
MNTSDCPREDSSAPLCPLDENSVRNGIWYPDEEACPRRNVPNWVKAQKAIVKVGAPVDRFFTVGMLQAITRVQKGITGIDPDQPFEEAKKAEQGFIEAFKRRQNSKGKKEKNGQSSLAKKRKDLVGVSSTSHQGKGGRNDT